jgi:hypothetical protein
MGLDIYLKWKGQSEAEHGYLRSAYNSAGFNTWCKRMIGEDGYYFIFDYSEAREVDGKFSPDWKLARKRALELLGRALTLPPLRILEVRSLVMEDLPDPSKVLSIYLDEVKKDLPPDGFSWFATKAGEFFLKDPPTVKAAIWTRPTFGDHPDLQLVIEDPDANSYYIQSLQETLKFIDLGREKNGWMTWSG